jgi:hypothetical protein
MTEEKAIELYDSKFWEKMDYRQRADFQLFEKRLCMPFDVFQEAMEKTLGRPVFTHEFGLNLEGLKKELRGEAGPPSMEEIINMIPEEKRIILVVDREES